MNIKQLSHETAMTRTTSLSSYFKNTDPVTLDNCDKEQIHLSAAIQPIGVLLVVDPLSAQIIAASENASSVFDIGTRDILSLSLSDISADLAEQVDELTDNSQILYEVLDYQLTQGEIQYDAVTHQHVGRRIIEFIPNNNPSAQNLRKKMRFCSKSCSHILKSENFIEGMQIAVDAVREITGFSRVKIYQFSPDWSGETVAESRDGQLESYLGLHFPASDIPQQVRQIMLMVPYRAIGTACDDVIPLITTNDNSESLDLTWSLLRSVSTMHTQYIRNMGVNATFSCSLLHQDKLWGLIACHHNEEELLPFDLWGLVQEISATLMLRFDQQQRTDVSDMLYQLRILETRFASEVRKNAEVEDVIATLIPTLQEFLSADGFAFQYGTHLHLSGQTPPEDFVKELIGWAMSNRDSNDQFQTIELHKQWEPAEAYIDTACGVLIQPITTHRVCQLIWFRGPKTQLVHWAGEHKDKQAISEDGILEPLRPRSSFKRWLQEHDKQSQPWREAELESAREIFKEFLDIIASQVLLKEENSSLRSFTANAAHDIRAPLRGITMALEAMDEENFEESMVRETHAIAHRSAKRLTDLTAALLDLTLITEQKHEFNPTDLNVVVSSITDLLAQEIADSCATIEIDELPTIEANSGLISRLFLNLISNSLKYAHPERKPRVEIRSASDEKDSVIIYVSDNGLGIDQEKARSVFKPLQRLHAAEEIEGTGLGLTICEKVLDVHGGSIELDANYTEGSSFIIRLPQEM